MTRDFETDALTSWRTAYTGSEHCTVPAGTVLVLDEDVSEPLEQVRFESVEQPEGEAYIQTIFPAAVKLGLEDPREHPDKWREVVYLTTSLRCRAENQAELEAHVIPESTRQHPKYGGYWFSIPLTAIGDGIEFLPGAREIAVQSDARFYVKESFECFGLRQDGVAAHCRVPAEVVLVPRHAIEERRLVSGWEMTHSDFTWWRSSDPGGKPSASSWTPTERVCPSRFLASCDPQFAEKVEADRQWDALLLPTDLIGEAILLA